MPRTDAKPTHVLKDIWIAHATQLLQENPDWWSRYHRDTSHYSIYRKVGTRVEEVMSYPRFRQIIEAYFARAKRAIIQGEALNMRCSLGKICAKRVERDFRKKKQRRINWNKTKRIPDNLVWNEDKQKHVYRKMVYFTDDDWCRIAWNKNGQVRNETLYEFKPSARGSGGTQGFKKEFVDAQKQDPLLKFRYLFNPLQMIYTSTSIKDVIGRVIRGTSLQQGDLIGRMDEWIPEAMGYMKTRVTLERCWTPLKVRFHKTALPCGLRSILAVEWNGHRVAKYNGTRAAGAPLVGNSPSGGLTVFGTAFNYGDPVQGTIKQVQDLPLAEGAYYYTELGQLVLSHETADLVLHFRRIPMDQEGFPLIPDNENYKQAIYWYCRAMLIGAGYKDTVFTYEACEQRFERHAARAISEIKYPSVDDMDARLAASDRFLLPEGWADSFFSPLSEEGTIG